MKVLACKWKIKITKKKSEMEYGSMNFSCVEVILDSLDLSFIPCHLIFNASAT